MIFNTINISFLNVYIVFFPFVFKLIIILINIRHLLRLCAIPIERKCNFTLNVNFLPGFEWQEWVFHFSCFVFNFLLVSSARLDVGCAHWAQPTSRRSMSLTLRLLPKFWIQELQNLFDLGSGFPRDIWGILLTIRGVFPSTHKKHMSQCHQSACLWRYTSKMIRKSRTGLREVGGNVKCTSQSLTRCTGPLQVIFVINWRL